LRGDRSHNDSENGRTTAFRRIVLTEGLLQGPQQIPGGNDRKKSKGKNKNKGKDESNGVIHPLFIVYWRGIILCKLGLMGRPVRIAGWLELL